MFTLFYKRQASTLKIAYIFKAFRAQSSLWSLSARNATILRIQDRYLSSVILKLLNDAFETAEFCYIVGLAAALHLFIKKEKPHFSLTCSFFGA